MNNRFQNNNRNNNYRSGDNRRGYQNGYQNRNNGYNTDRNKAHHEWRSDRESNDRKIGYQSDGRNHQSVHSNGQTTHMPGIRVIPNQSSTPFVSNEVKLNDCANGSGDQNCQQLPIESISNKLSQMEIKVKESETPIKTEVTSSVDTKEVPNGSVVNSSDNKTESESDPKNEEKVMATPKSVQEKRRNTIGSDFKPQYYRSFRRNESQPRSGQKFERFSNFNNKIQTTDPNKKYISNRGPKYSPNKNDYNYANYMPINPYLPNIHPYDPIHQFQQVFWQNPYYPNYYYGVPNPMMAHNSGEMAPELPNQSQRMQNDERSAKMPEQSTQSDLNAYPTQFLPFKPSPECPVPPIYYGNVKRYNTENGFAFYFESVIPAGIWPLPLDVDLNGGPILPSNCRQLCPGQ